MSSDPPRELHYPCTPYPTINVRAFVPHHRASIWFPQQRWLAPSRSLIQPVEATYLSRSLLADHTPERIDGALTSGWSSVKENYPSAQIPNQVFMWKHLCVDIAASDGLHLWEKEMDGHGMEVVRYRLQMWRWLQHGDATHTFKCFPWIDPGYCKRAFIICVATFSLDGWQHFSKWSSSVLIVKSSLSTYLLGLVVTQISEIWKGPTTSATATSICDSSLPMVSQNFCIFGYNAL